MPREVTDQMIYDGITKGSTKDLEKIQDDLKDWMTHVEAELNRRRQSARVVIESLPPVVLEEIRRPRP